MRFRLPRPLHGWREFAYEIVIVVIGVLLAVAGAQLIDTLNTRSEVASFREAVDHELGRDLGIYQSMMPWRACVTRRTRELEKFLTDARAGRHDPLARPIGRPFMQTFYFSAWDNKGSAVTDQLPFKLRTAYGEVYDEFRENEKVLLNERDAWRSLAQFEQPLPLDVASQLRLRELLSRVEQYNEVTPGNYDYIVTLAQPLGIHPIRDTIVAHVPSDASFCQPLFAHS
ncbi:MAG TPA: hypothetical protein VNS11_07830 [Sphingomicrobium sp.]|nr:hypothetical protein [Sphingomicrobium sp.]